MPKPNYVLSDYLKKELYKLVWLSVTFLTPKDEERVLLNFSKILPPKSEVIKRFGLAFTLGIVLLILNLVALFFLLS